MTVITNAPVTASAPMPAGLTDIRDIKPPIEISTGWEWLWWVVAGVVVLAVCYITWSYFRRRKATASIEVEIPAHERARRKLEAALDLYDQPKPFCIVVSDAVRLYLEERFGLRAPERTTEEFLTDLSRSAALTELQKDSMKDFLSACDMVKFAKYEPQRPELEALYNSALRLIEETEPRPRSAEQTPKPEAAVAQ